MARGARGAQHVRVCACVNVCVCACVNVCVSVWGGEMISWKCEEGAPIYHFKSEG